MYKLGFRELEHRQSLRGKYAEGLCWYAVMVHTGREPAVERYLAEDVADALAEAGEDEGAIGEVLLPIMQEQAPRSGRTGMARGRDGHSEQGAQSEQNGQVPGRGIMHRQDAHATLSSQRPGRPARPATGMAAQRGEFLFRSYLFLRCAMSDALYTAICEHKAVYQILGQGYRIPSVLEDDEMDNLRKVLRGDGRPQMVSRRNTGDTVEILEGLMAGIRGRVVTANAREVKLELAFSFLDMGTGVLVSVPRSHVRILSHPCPARSGERVCYA